jgi:hypothetical protein
MRLRYWRELSEYSVPGVLNDALQPIVFLIDVDNTLLDNDAIQHHLKDHLERSYGRAARERYWKILEDLFGVRP